MHHLSAPDEAERSRAAMAIHLRPNDNTALAISLLHVASLGEAARLPRMGDHPHTSP
jgi:hypothetical protein